MLADIITQLRDELTLLEREADGCRDLGCINHAHLSHRIHDIHQQLARLLNAPEGVNP